MADYGRQPPPLWFWIVAILATLWGMAGIFAFYTDTNMSAAALAALPEYDRNYMLALPGWFAWVYAMATWGGLLGGILLLARRRLASVLFAVSLVAVVVQFGWVFLATDMIAAKGVVTAIAFPLFILAMALFQLWFTSFAAKRGWVR